MDTNHAVPFGTDAISRAERIAQAVEDVDAIPRVNLESRYAEMDARDARAERLSGHIPAGCDAL